MYQYWSLITSALPIWSGGRSSSQDVVVLSVTCSAWMANASWAVKPQLGNTPESFKSTALYTDEHTTVLKLSLRLPPSNFLSFYHLCQKSCFYPSPFFGYTNTTDYWHKHYTTCWWDLKERWGWAVVYEAEEHIQNLVLDFWIFFQCFLVFVWEEKDRRELPRSPRAITCT